MTHSILTIPVRAIDEDAFIEVFHRPDGYQSWLDAPIRATLRQEIEPLLAGPMTGSLYDEVGA